MPSRPPPGVPGFVQGPPGAIQSLVYFAQVLQLQYSGCIFVASAGPVPGNSPAPLLLTKPLRGGYMTEQDAQRLHDGICELEELARTCRPGANSLYTAIGIVHAAMHLGEAGLATLVEFQNGWIETVGLPLANAIAADRAKAAQSQTEPKPDPGTVNPSSVYDHFTAVEKLADQLRNGGIYGNPDTHNPQ